MLQLEECTKAKEKRDEEARLVVRDITKSKTKCFKVTVKTKQQYKYYYFIVATSLGLIRPSSGQHSEI
jgi:hypothetical protein